MNISRMFTQFIKGVLLKKIIQTENKKDLSYSEKQELQMHD